MRLAPTTYRVPDCTSCTQGEAVVPAKYNRGGLDSESRQLLGVIAVASKQQLKILKRFEYLGIPQSTRQAVA